MRVMRAGNLIVVCLLIVGCGLFTEPLPDIMPPALPVTTPPTEPNGGYILFAPLFGTSTYLIDNDGRLIHDWEHDNRPANSNYLLENGHLLRAEDLGLGSVIFNTRGGGGRIVEYTWEGEVVWSFAYVSSTTLQHHDIERMPNGNILLIAWELKTREEVLAAGRSPDLLDEDNDGELWVDHVAEVDPASGEVVWEWHAWDHLIQDADPDQANYGVVADHPELIDINYDMAPLRSDWLHTNAIDYNPDLDQIMISVREFSEIWIIDHSTTTDEATGHSGGRSGKGGDLLYRWGNPAAYRAGRETDRQLFFQHDSQWIDSDLRGGDNILIFNNGAREIRPYTGVVEIVPPLHDDGLYDLPSGMPAPPAEPVWQYQPDPAEEWFSIALSGVQRQPNGNTLICAGTLGEFVEVTAAGEVVWHYDNPVYGYDEDIGWGNFVFRAERYPADYPAFEGKYLTPGKLLSVPPPDDPAPTPTG